jgi:hypothetical protein
MREFGHTVAAASPILPAGVRSFPRWIIPERKVPVVRITDLANNSDPSSNRIPTTLSSLMIKSSTLFGLITINEQKRKKKDQRRTKEKEDTKRMERKGEEKILPSCKNIQIWNLIKHFLHS